MATNKYNFWELRPAEEINPAIKELPIAKEVTLLRGDTKEEIATKKAIIVDDEIVQVCSDKYVLVQHEKAFRPVIDGLTVSSVSNFEFMIWNTLGKASLSIMVGESEDGVKYGFRVTNSVDGSQAIRFGYRATKKDSYVEVVDKEEVVLWGYRQICDNGMKIRVPLKTVKYVDAETRTKVTELLEGRERMKHLGTTLNSRLDTLQYIVEAMLLLREPLNRMIIDAQRFKITRKDAEQHIKRFVSQRKLDMFLEQFDTEHGDNLWTLYNSVTWFASHEQGLSVEQRENFVDKASEMLTEVLVTTQ